MRLLIIYVGLGFFFDPFFSRICELILIFSLQKILDSKSVIIVIVFTKFNIIILDNFFIPRKILEV